MLFIWNPDRGGRTWTVLWLLLLLLSFFVDKKKSVVISTVSVRGERQHPHRVIFNEICK